MEELADATAAGATPRSRRSSRSTAVDRATGRPRSTTCQARYQDAAREHMKKCTEALRTDARRVGTSCRTTRSPLAPSNSPTLRCSTSRFGPASRCGSSIKDKHDLSARQTEPTPQRPTRRAGAPGAPSRSLSSWPSLPELVDPTHQNRTLVDLIFFPTGGGKTEAYLGASAISLLARRLRNPDDAGTDTLMRYTLRLLTAQQFLRASSLICVLEDVRSGMEDELGTAPFGIGVWLGGDSTPNRWTAAERSLAGCAATPEPEQVLAAAACPWCGTRMGTKSKASRGGRTLRAMCGRAADSSSDAKTSCAGSVGETACPSTSSTRTSTSASVDRDRHRRQVRHDGLASPSLGTCSDSVTMASASIRRPA